jgi:putative ABC transport system permease protein
LAPALRSSRVELTESLKAGVWESAGFARSRLRSLLVVTQIAMALVLLVGAGLLLKSFGRLLQVNPGFQPQNLLTAQIALPGYKYREPHQVRDFYQQVLERVSAAPGVQSAGVVSDLPLSRSNTSGVFFIEGRDVAPDQPRPQADWRVVSPGYLQTMGIPLLNGRHFSERDSAEAANVMIIDETLARRYWPDEDPIGKRARLTNTRERIWREVVGVVGAVRHAGLDADHRGTLYVPHAQAAWPNLFLVVRAGSEPANLLTAMRAAVRSVDPEQPVYGVATMESRLADSVAQRRFSLVLLGLFASVALLLAVVGLYGAVAYSVSQRTHEIGIRMALGAQLRDVLRLVIRQGMTLVFLGVGVGLTGAVALTRVLTSLLFEVNAIDPAVFVLIPALLSIVALVACWVPARRAARVDPMVALRYE